MKTGTALIIGATAVLGLLLGANLFPKHITEYETITLPSTPDTVLVQDTIIETRWRIREVVTTDTLNLTDTVRITIERPIDELNRLFIDTIQVGEFFGDSTYVATTRIRADSTGLFRTDELHRLITIGYLRSLAATPEGIEVDFAEFPKPPPSCNLGCRLQWGLGGAAAGLILGVVFGG
jgi:hypothetical protein